MSEEQNQAGQGEARGERRERKDKGAKRGARAGAYILQAQDPDDVRRWTDIGTFARESAAWASVEMSGPYRVVRQHGKTRIASTQTTIKFV